MGRIKKAAGPKHEATMPPVLSVFVSAIPNLPLPQLPGHLNTFPAKWPFPRGDLYHWIHALDHFDDILEQFINHYGLKKGPQTQEFGTRILQDGLPKVNPPIGSTTYFPAELQRIGFGAEGDRELVEAILSFSRMLLENCGNRSLYNSSDRLGDLLHTVSLPLLVNTLRLTSRLAVRYHYSRARTGMASHLNSALLASHYNINLEYVQKLADTFVNVTPAAPSSLVTTSAPVGKAKEPETPKAKERKKLVANNLFDVATRTDFDSSDPFAEWGDLHMTYYQPLKKSEEEPKELASPQIASLTSQNPLSTQSPTTPTPVRRSAGLARPPRTPANGDAPASSSKPEESSSNPGLRTVSIPRSTILSTSTEKLIEAHLPDAPSNIQYEFLTRVRIAKAMSESVESRRLILSARILAITNLAYIYPEALFQQKILQRDSDEPRHLQIVEQLRKIVHNPENGDDDISLELKTVTLGALEALVKHKSRTADVCGALGINVSHGSLLCILRKVVADLANDDAESDTVESDEYRETLFSLLEALPSTGTRTAETLIAAGLFETLVEALNLRTKRAERVHYKVLIFVNMITHTVRDAYQNFATSKGLDALSNLIDWEVTSSLECVQQGKGLSPAFRSQVMDYQMPFFQQQTLRWLFKFVNHMMTYNNANVDRLLRNLIDSPQLLNGLCKVIANGKVFGSNIWSGAVSIMSSFIHNEPTSYAVVAEAGLSKGLLEAVSQREIGDSNPGVKADSSQTNISIASDGPDAVTVLLRQGSNLKPESTERILVKRLPGEKLARGTLPASDAIINIPSAFGAICLNASGLELFLRSRALDAFLEIFESPEHIKSLTSQSDLPKILGSAFDELIRHHPKLKTTILRAVIVMVARVGRMCKEGEAAEQARMMKEFPDITGRHKTPRTPAATGSGDVFMEGSSTSTSGEKSTSSEEASPTVAEIVGVVSRFLSGFCENQMLCSSIVQSGGLEFILNIATVSTLPYTFHDYEESHEIARVLHTLAEHKPHLVMPAILMRMKDYLTFFRPYLAALDNEKGASTASFLYLVSPSDDESHAASPSDLSQVLKALTAIGTLCDVLHVCFSQTSYNSSRSSHSLFTQANLADLYIDLSKDLSKLYQLCVWDGVKLQDRFPKPDKLIIPQLNVVWDIPETMPRGIAQLPGPHNLHTPDTSPVPRGRSGDTAAERRYGVSTVSSGPSGPSGRKEPPGSEDHHPLEYLLGHLPLSMTLFFSGLGKSLIPKRRIESYQRQNAYMVADAIAKFAIESLQFDAVKNCKEVRDQFEYWFLALTSIQHLLTEEEPGRHQCYTIVVHELKKQGGFEIMNHLLEIFCEAQLQPNQSTDVFKCARDCMGVILNLYARLASAKTITESNSTQGMITPDRDRGSPYYFSDNQFIVELRAAILPAVELVWSSRLVEKAENSILKSLISVLRSILEADCEHKAYKRGDEIPQRKKNEFKVFPISSEKMDGLKAKGADHKLAQEALYRCLGSREPSDEYATAHLRNINLPRLPVPAYDQEQRKQTTPPPPPPPPAQPGEEQAADNAGGEDATDTDLDVGEGASEQTVSEPLSLSADLSTDNSEESPSEEAEEGDPESDHTPTENALPVSNDADGDGMAMSIDNLLSLTDQLPAPNNMLATENDAKDDSANSEKVVTVTDLNEARDELRKTLIDHVLDILSTHGNLTFELSDLIQTAAAKAPDVSVMRREIGQTLVQSIISFQMEENFKDSGKKIAAYANLLAVLMQQKDFYDAVFDELLENFTQLLGFIKVFPSTSPEDTHSPWIGQILLVLERLLAEGVQPQQIKWTPPTLESPEGNEDSGASIEASLASPVSLEDKTQLFNSIMELLPQVGKDQSLALSVARILVILSRERSIANSLADKRNLQRMFVMTKQLAGISDDKYQKAIMLVLRHIIEDDATIKDVMQSEILSFFRAATRARPHDTQSYVRNMAHLVLRSPPLFLEVTNTILKLQSFDPNSRQQTLTLREQYDISSKPADNNLEMQMETQAIDNPAPEPSSSDPLHLSTEQNGGDASREKTKPTEPKTPALQHPDGVIHYLLSELLSYKDVEDKEPELKDNDKPATLPPIQSNGADSTLSTPAPQLPSPVVTDTEKKPEKAEYKPEQHPIYNYRCLILQFLTELLMCYNRAKIEFINFSRKADPKTMTPSKPRSGILNYLLNNLIPLGSIDRSETLAAKKKYGLSNWAMSTLVGLCNKPAVYSMKRDDEIDDDPNPDLLFVRKFVLENALKSFKDASLSTEPLDTKYSRLLCLSDLFTRILLGRVLPNIPSYANDIPNTTQREIARLMFEKGFISTLTTSIADIDLNYPNSRRVVKYVLKPLRILTETAVYLSQNSNIPLIPGQTEDDEISTATSVTEMDEGREETPDLFRNSTLGILDPGREEDSSSDASDEDEDMYDDDEYDEGMEVEDELEPDEDEVISDEDEEIGNRGPVEGLPGDVGMDVEVVINGEENLSDEDDLEHSEDLEDDDGEDDDDDDDDDDDEDLSDEEAMRAMDEISDAGFGDGLDEGQEGEWQDEDEGEDGEEDYDDDTGAEEPNLAIANIEGGVGASGGGDESGAAHSQEEPDQEDHAIAVRDLVVDLQSSRPAPPPGDFTDIEMDVEGDRYIPDMEIIRDEDEIDEGDDDEDIEDEELAYEQDYEEPPPWGWDVDDEHVHHRHRPHNTLGRITSPMTWVGRQDRGIFVPNYRSHHRPVSGQRADDGTNPLLRRGDVAPVRRGLQALAELPPGFADWMQMIQSRHRGRADGAMGVLDNMMNAISQSLGENIHLHITAPSRNGGTVVPLPDIRQLLSRAQPDPRVARDDTSFVPLFHPQRTIKRWQEECQLLFGPAYSEKTQRIINSMLKILVPSALEEERIRKEKEREEEARRVKEAEDAAREAERLAKEKAEREAQEQKERKEKEEREAAERAAAEQTAPAPTESSGSAGDGEAMEGVETTDAEQRAEPTTNEGNAGQESSEAGPSAESERIRATFRGREVDITGLGIDLEYLNALPDDLREEVLMQQLAEQRSQAAVSGEAPTEISPEFLEALPPDIREEILQTEAQNRRRRERDEAHRQSAGNGTAPAARAEDMDTASFLASLDPVLRNAVLLEQDDAMLAQLPAEIATEARTLLANRFGNRWDGMPRLQRSNAQRLAREEATEAAARKPRRQVVQILDKAGVATLVRLLFISQQGTSKEALNKILESVSQNRQNRVEVLSLLLSVLQDGSADSNAIERSFLHLTSRAKQSALQKSPHSARRSSNSAPLNSEMTPLMVIQQCLSALVYLTDNNMHVPSYFLSEHESPAALKNKSARKGKNKESKDGKYPLNCLLSLLDRKMILDSAGCMEQLSMLLQSITHPLIILHKKDKEVTTDNNKTGETNAPSQASAEQPTVSAVEVTEELPENRTNEENTNGQNAISEATANDAPAANDVATVDDAESAPPKEAKEKEDEPAAKKQRTLTPPSVPDENLRLVVNILAARECSGKIFRDTVSTINNLSAIPDAKEVFGNELIRQAQNLGGKISNDLDELLPQLQSAGSSNNVHSAALAKFQPSSSDQAKLLRVLTALDYLFDPKRSASRSESGDSASKDAQSKGDMLTSLYESSTFGPLWNKLSECLSCVRQRHNSSSLNVATILLPLVETLMVVCKNTTLKDNTIAKLSKDFNVSSPAPESSVQNLFFRFTEEHRKILNDLVRHNPRLMSGTFSVLVKNPKVLEFDNKRNYFTRRLHSRTEARQPQPPLQLSVRRELVFHDSYRALYFKTPEEIKYGKLSIRFLHEEGVDAGGVTREWFQAISRQMFNPDYALFIPVASDRTTFHPNKLSQVNEHHLMYFKFIGRIIGKALYEGRALDCHFSRAVYKRILGKTVSIKDMENLDLDYYKSLIWMLENDISDIITETFSTETENFGVTEIVDLIENGRNVLVTEENKQEYVQRIVEYRLTGSVKAQLEDFLKGFHDIVPAELISIFNEQELELLISGLPDIDVDDWKNNTEYHNYSASSPQIQWFWRAVRSFDKEERAKLLQFVTGTSKVPLNGFKELEGMNGFSRFNIHRDYGNKDRLPSSHTCFNQLDLPEYDSYETLRQQLYTAVTAGSEYFGFA